MIIAKSKQTPADISLQHFGTTDNTALIAYYNGEIDLHAEIGDATKLITTGIDVENSALVDYYINNQITIATYTE